MIHLHDLTTDSLLFLDVCNYIAAGTSYAKWIKSWGVTEATGFFPFEKFTSLDYLNQTEPPFKQDFYISLRQSNISDADYQHFLASWKDNGFKNMKDVLIWYNNLDVTPMLQALDNMCALWRTLDIDMLKVGAISLPGLSYIRLVKTMPNHVHIAMWTKDQAICGGPSIVWKRYAEKDPGV